jgi:hypothetical protein
LLAPAGSTEVVDAFQGYESLMAQLTDTTEKMLEAQSRMTAAHQTINSCRAQAVTANHYQEAAAQELLTAEKGMAGKGPALMARFSAVIQQLPAMLAAVDSVLPKQVQTKTTKASEGDASAAKDAELGESAEGEGSGLLTELGSVLSELNSLAELNSAARDLGPLVTSAGQLYQRGVRALSVMREIGLMVQAEVVLIPDAPLQHMMSCQAEGYGYQELHWVGALLEQLEPAVGKLKGELKEVGQVSWAPWERSVWFFWLSWGSRFRQVFEPSHNAKQNNVTVCYLWRRGKEGCYILLRLAMTEVFSLQE